MDKELNSLYMIIIQALSIINLSNKKCPMDIFVNDYM